MGRRKLKRGERERILFAALSTLLLSLLVGIIVALAVPQSATTTTAVTERALPPQEGDCDAATMQTTIDAFAEAETPVIFHCNADVLLMNGLVIKGNVTIVGQDPELRSFRVFMDGANYAERLFYLRENASLTLVSVELTRSRRYGVYATPGSQLTLDDVVFTSISEGSSDGAAIYNEGGVVVASHSFISSSWGEVAIKNEGEVWMEDSVIWSSVGCIENGEDGISRGVEESCVDA
ncbi:right-handed parallel beta-helix repeat-containing protein [Phototrophicus methaneseepsis]|uniref:Right-handed parallel beta-helix repeat-containing protein n=1 Tax=Phototrophicus methaneseepsis TaxID=2710758 RepID=A0A7S8E8P1_9CHLR|nr:right-handed parallel beta-helix repeat-containing protein [Phototrophicus methaneseepsis]QPC82400.1 right-handed parallel beta-helix repeat-containing protein [Phototrophicus methaneseepsis]